MFQPKGKLIMEKKDDDCKRGELITDFVLANGRCHQPQLALIVLCNESGTKLYDKLDRSQRMIVNKSLVVIWDTWKPISMTSNCGHNYQSGRITDLCWLLNYDINSYTNLLTELADNEESSENKEIIRNQLKHYLYTQERWNKVKYRCLLEQIMGDIKLYQQLKLPNKDEMTKYSKLSKLNFYRYIIFNHTETWHPQCTSLSIEILTDFNREELKMADFTQEINQSTDILIKLVNKTSNAIGKYIASIIDEQDAEKKMKYHQALKWFELGIFVTNQQNSDKVSIVVYCQITALHYIFMLLYKLEYSEIIKFSDNYIKYMNELYQEQTIESMACPYRKHYELHLETFERKFKNYRFIGHGVRNAKVSTQRIKLAMNENMKKALVDSSIKHCNDKLYRGICVSWSDHKGFGWINFDDTDIFVHHMHLRGVDGCNYHSLMVGEQVEFRIGTDAHGRIAARQVVPVKELLGKKRMTSMIPKEEAHVSGATIRGICVRWFSDRGYGWINFDDVDVIMGGGSQYIHVHHSQVKGCLIEGEDVEFQIGINAFDGRQTAKRVIRVNGDDLIGNHSNQQTITNIVRNNNRYPTVGNIAEYFKE